MKNTARAALLFAAVLAVAVVAVACSSAGSAFRSASPASSPSADNASESPATDGPAPHAGLLTAGTWRDLDDWARFLEVMGSKGPFAGLDARWGLDLSRRLPVVVADDSGALVDVGVRALDKSGALIARGRTDNKGRAELFLNGLPENAGVRIAVDVDGCAPRDVDGGPPVRTAEATRHDAVVIERDQGFDDMQAQATPLEPVRIACTTRAQEAPAVLDLMLVVDTTGSMGDELTYLKTELEDVVTRVARDQRVEVRVAVDAYRDQGDEYLVRGAPFRSAHDAVAFLGKQSADGGGDFPEALDEALVDAVETQQWSEHARARIALLVLDAPPHEDQESLARIHRAVKSAAARGIRLIPVAASGIDQATEALLRSMAVATGGTYVFLTNDSGVGNTHLAPTVGAYKVEPLNDLLVRVIGEAVAVDNGDHVAVK